MNLKLRDYVKSVLMLSIFIVSLLMCPNVCLAAQTGNDVNGVTTLEKNTEYEYDLNGDGKADKIQYKVTTDDENMKTSLQLYINDKLCLSRHDYGYGYTIQICDLDKSDHYLDLFIYETVENDCIQFSFFTRYDGEKLFHMLKFDPEKIIKNFSTSRYYLDSVKEDGRFTVTLDTPIFSYNFGCYYCYVPFRVKDNGFTADPVKTYTLTKGSGKYKYKAAQKFSAYEKVGSKKAVLQVKKGDKVTIDKIYVSKSGKLYFRILNSVGKKGWVKSEKNNLFAQYPAWG